MLSKRLTRAMVIMVTLVVLITMNSGIGAAKKRVIGFIPMTLNNEFFIVMCNAAKMEAEQLGVDILVQAGQRHASTEEQLQIIENMIIRKVDAICIVPASPVGLMPALKKAEAAGIPVINVDTEFDADLVSKSGLKPIPFVGTDNYAAARLAGEYAVKLLGGKGRVAILTGLAGQQSGVDRRNGFYDVVKGKLDVVAEQTANWEIEQGYNVCQNILQAHRDLALVFACNDNMALGALRAIKEARRDVKVIGFDGIPEALKSVAEGGLTATIAQRPTEMGRQAVRLAVDMLNGKTVPKDTRVGAAVITVENAREFAKSLEKYK